MKKKLILLFLSFLCIFTVTGCFDSTTNVSQHRIQWWLTEINWDQHRLPYDGSGVVVAVVDSGIDSTHPDLQGKIIAEYRVPSIGDDNNVQSLGHGTAVAGIIAAEPSTSNGVLGISPGSRIISIDVTDDINNTVEPQALIEGIRYAINQDVQIINISIGFLEHNKSLDYIVNEAIRKGIIVVAAAGNNMTESVLYPSKLDGVFCVGSYKRNGKRISPLKDVEDVVFLPGEYVVTTYSGEDNYISAEGTSFSTPILTGIIALILQKKPNYTNNEIRELIESTESLDVNKMLK